MGSSLRVVDLIENVLLIEFDVFAAWDSAESVNGRFVLRSKIFK